MKDLQGREVTPPEPYKLTQEACEITDCPSNSGFSCALSVYAHKDAIRPKTCHHRKFKLRKKGG